MAWTYCPECGSDKIRHQQGHHKQCVCGQEWFADVDYTDVVQKHLSGAYVDKDATIARLTADLEAARTQRDEADRRAGAAERKNESLLDSESRRANWLHKAKIERGYHSNVSFDLVWKETCEKADRAQAALSLLPRAYEAGRERYRLTWIAGARPPVHPEPMKGRQNFLSEAEAWRFFRQQADDAILVSLEKSVTIDCGNVPPPADLAARLGGE